MIIPKPYEGENRGAFMIRCTSTLIGEGVGDNESVEICKKQYTSVEFSPFVFALEGELLLQVYAGFISEKYLPQYLYEFHYKNIQGAVGTGFGFPSDIKENTLRHKTALAFRKNVSFFSGAKTFQQTSLLSRLVFNEDGTKRPFSEFKGLAMLVNEEYNKNYLRTEQNSAYSLAQSAEAWQEIQDYKEILPLLKYVTVGDARVRYEHRLWDGIIRPVDDVFWDTHFPPNDWNCRCIVTSLSEGKITNLDKHLTEFNKKVPQKEQIKTLKNPSKTFLNNPGKTGVIYGKGHSYFDIPYEYKKSALVNFGFDMPKDDEVKEILKNIKR